MTGALPARIVARGLTLPLVRRFQVGEGVLLAINLSLLVALRTPLGAAVALAALSVGILALMYALNDWWDARRDLDNPRKDRALASDLHTYRRAFALALAGGHALAVASALSFAGWRSGVIAAAVLATNAVYSFFCKGIPVIDVAIVGVWGGMFAALVGPAAAALPVGAMTAVSHVFQAMGDRDADMRAGVATTAASRKLALWVLGGCSVVLVAGLVPLVGVAVALAGLVPIVLALTVRKSFTAWMASKVAFAAVWLVVLWGLHGSR